MPEKRLHIIAFDVPFPPNYGGVIDIYYKLKALYKENVKIVLHCFEYGRGQKIELEKYCDKVFYYKRKAKKRLLFSSLPYIVATRASEELMKNLIRDDSPILFEGLHCCFYLNDARIKNRRKIVRMHNIEHAYYSNLAQVEKKFFKRKFFEQEAKKLENFETTLKYADIICAISPADTKYLSGKYKNVKNIMAFHPHDTIEIKEGKGDVVLYHASLAVGENNKAALYLVNEVFNDSTVPFIIAGNGASVELKKAVKDKKNIQLHENISIEEIYTLIQNAQINILPTFQATGIKLKLLSALYSGKHCLVNTPMVSNTGLEPLCHIADSAAEMKKKITELMILPFNGQEKEARKKILEEKFSNQTSARKLLGLLF